MSVPMSVPCGALARALLLTSLLIACACSGQRIITGTATDGGGDGPPVATAVDAAAANPPDAGFSFTVADASDLAPPPPAELDCAGATAQPGNAGCSFYAMHALVPESHGCFAMFVVNPGKSAVTLDLSRAGRRYSLNRVARLPRGSGRALTYAPYDEAGGLAPGDVAIVFLMMGQNGIACPRGVQPALDWTVNTPGLDQAFHLVSDRPVIAYQILPYGGAGSHVTSATLLLPQESWGTTYVVPTPRVDFSVVVVTAAHDDTSVVFRAPGGGGGGDRMVMLNAGGVASFLGRGVRAGLSGGAVRASKPVGVIGAMTGEYLPGGSLACCADTGQQQIPPLATWGHEYVAVRHRSRVATEEPGLWQIVGAADGTTLSYAPAAPPGAPAALSAGQVVEFTTSEPFVVRSQDERHPFYVGSFMTSALFADPTGANGNAGDPDFVNVVPTAQYARSYSFFTDPTYPETSLVVVRRRGADGQFADVKLDCAAAPIAGWRPVGDVEYARVDLVTGDFRLMIPGCDNGRQGMSSAAPFGVTVWGWGTSRVKVGAEDTSHTSYGYPAGAALRATNDVKPTIIP